MAATISRSMSTEPTKKKPKMEDQPAQAIPRGTIKGVIHSWSPAWGGYIVSPEINGTLPALKDDATGIDESHVGVLVSFEVNHNSATKTTRAVNVTLLTQAHESEEAYTVTIMLAEPCIQQGRVKFPEINWDSIETGVEVEVQPTENVSALIEKACIAMEEKILEGVEMELGIEPVCLTHPDVCSSDGRFMPLMFEQPVKQYFKPADTGVIFGDVIDVAAIGMPHVPEEEKLPITIITGFLGSGKTTFLKYILTQQREKKFVVIENEFGQESIDTMILEGSKKMETAEKLITMDNGCMCCTVRSDIVEALRQVVQAIDNGAKFDGVLIETTGVADPAPIVRTFMECADPRVVNAMRMDGIITMVDAKHILGRLSDPMLQTEEAGGINEAHQQIAYADRVILNKVDLVSHDDLSNVKRTIRELNRFARVIPATRGRIDLKHLESIRTLDLNKFLEDDGGLEEQPDDEARHDKTDCNEQEHAHEHAHEHTHEHGHGHSHEHEQCGESCSHEHEHGQHVARGTAALATSFALTREGEVANQRRLIKFLQSVAQSTADGHAKQLFRCKGVVAMKNCMPKRVFQMVQDSFDQDDLGEWKDDEQRVCKVVFIGVELNRAHFETLMDKLVEP